MTKPHVAHRSVVIDAADGQKLAGTLFTPAEPRGLPVMIFPATGVNQRLYAPFALWLAQQGRTVLTIDFRGIGASLFGAHPKHSKALKQEWGQFDMPAALDWLLHETGATEADVVGHSAGAQLVGLMPNHGRIHHLVAVSGSSGYLGNMRLKMRLGGGFMLNVLAPLANRFIGYTPASRIGWGDDLPPGIARQWGEWCSRPGYVANAFGKEIERHFYTEMTTPTTVIRASDDAIVPLANVHDWLRLMPQVNAEIITVSPSMVGGKPIGHAGMFRRSHHALWPMMAAAIGAG